MTGSSQKCGIFPSGRRGWSEDHPALLRQRKNFGSIHSIICRGIEVILKRQNFTSLLKEIPSIIR